MQSDFPFAGSFLADPRRFVLRHGLLCTILSAVFSLPLAGAGYFDAEGFIRQLPTAEEIDAAFPLGGPDPVEAAAKRSAAYRLVGVVIAESNGRDGSPANLSPVESTAYRQYSDAGPVSVRQEMGWPRVGFGGNRDIERYDNLLTDYVWRNKGMAEEFAAEFSKKLFAGKEHLLPETFLETRAQRALISFSGLLALFFGICVGTAIAKPWKFFREGVLVSMGSGIAKTTPGLVSMTYLERNHLSLGDKRWGTTALSPRIDAALEAALESRFPIRVGMGRTVFRNWALSVKSPAEAVREPVITFCLHTFFLLPIVTLLAVVCAAFMGPATGSGLVALFSMAAAASFGAGLVFKNLLAWIA